MSIFCCVQTPRTLDFRAPVEAKSQFSQNRPCRFKSKNRSENRRILDAKIDQKSPKIFEKTRLKTHCALTSIFNGLGLHFGSQVGAQKVVPGTLFRFFLQDRPNMAPRAPQEPPKSAPRVPKSAQDRPKSAQDSPKSVPRGSQKRPRRAQERPQSVQNTPTSAKTSETQKKKKCKKF